MNTSRKAQWLENELKENNFSAACIHSSLSQNERQAILDQFRQGNLRILILTDLMSRGVVIDVHCLLVINYDIPTNIENYAHRVARKKVTSVINFVSSRRKNITINS